MATRELSKLNELAWTAKAAVIEELYPVWDQRSLQEDIANPDVIENRGCNYIDEAYEAAICGLSAISTTLLSRGIEMLQYVLDAGIVKQSSTIPSAQTAATLESDRESTLDMTKTGLGMGLWLRDGSYPSELFVQAASHAWRYFELNRSSKTFDVLELYLLTFARADLYKELLEAYDSGKSLISTRRRDQLQNASLACVAEYLLGNNEIKGQASFHVEYWYSRSIDWRKNSTFRLFHRLVWARLRGQMITGREDIHDLLDELKGF